MRINVYIDGFNLYFRALKSRRQLRWLNVAALSRLLLAEGDEIKTINYYTALVNDTIDEGADIRQLAYLRALRTIENIEIHRGNFLTKKTWSRLRQPPRFKPEQSDEIVFNPEPEVAATIRSEEKGSDVNLAAHLVRDAFQDKFDACVVISNDTDLCEAMRIVKDEVRKPVLLFSPSKRAAPALQSVASTVRYIRAGHLEKSQFPDEITLSEGRRIHRPEGWAI